MPPLPVGKLPAQLLQRLFTKYVAADPRVVVRAAGGRGRRRPRHGRSLPRRHHRSHHLRHGRDGLVRAARQCQRPRRARRHTALVHGHRAPARGQEPRGAGGAALRRGGRGVRRRRRLAGGRPHRGDGRAAAPHRRRRHAGRGGQGPARDDRRRAGRRHRAADQGRAARGRVDHRARARGRGAPARRGRRRSWSARAGFSAAPASAWWPRRARPAARRASTRCTIPTEGGLATACWELAQAAGVGLRIDRERVPVLPEGRRLCEAFGLDPLGTIASGSLLDDRGAGRRGHGRERLPRRRHRLRRHRPRHARPPTASRSSRAATRAPCPPFRRTRSPESLEEPSAPDRLRASPGADGAGRHGRLLPSARLAGRRRDAQVGRQRDRRRHRHQRRARRDPAQLLRRRRRLLLPLLRGGDAGASTS